MHNHDQEIIMALAEGTLPAPAAAAAEADLAACAECVRDLELQRIALATLSDAPRVYLSATESARLHDRLHRELAVPAPEPVRTRTQLAWGRWVGLAAGTAAVFLAAFLLLPNVLGGSSDESAELAFDATSEDLNDAGAAETTTAAAEAAPPLREGMVGLDDATAAEDGAAAAGEAPAALPTTTAAPETTLAGDTGDPTMDTANYLTYIHVGALSADVRNEILDQLSADSGYFRLADENVKRIEPEWELCVESTLDLDVFPAASDAQIVGIVVDDAGDDIGLERLLVAFVTADPDDTVLASITVPQCEVFETLP